MYRGLVRPRGSRYLAVVDGWRKLFSCLLYFQEPRNRDAKRHTDCCDKTLAPIPGQTKEFFRDISLSPFCACPTVWFLLQVASRTKLRVLSPAVCVPTQKSHHAAHCSRNRKSTWTRRDTHIVLAISLKAKMQTRYSIRPRKKIFGEQLSRLWLDMRALLFRDLKSPCDNCAGSPDGRQIAKCKLFNETMSVFNSVQAYFGGGGNSLLLCRPVFVWRKKWPSLTLT